MRTFQLTLLGADGAAGRESTICDAAMTGLAGGAGVVAGRDAGAETPLAGQPNLGTHHFMRLKPFEQGSQT